MPKIPVSLLTALALLAGALVGAALLQPRSVAAVDGQVNINQATVMAAGGFPYHINQPGSYKLSGNLMVPADTEGININADNVTLDLNGFSIIGPERCTGKPVTSCSGSPNYGIGVNGRADYITVKNGSVVGMKNGGVFLFGVGQLVEEVHVSQSAIDGITVVRGIVRRCTSDSNGNNGISIGNADDGGGVVEASNADFNGNTGILAINSVVIGNKASSNRSGGLLADSSVFGSNLFSQNGNDVSLFPGATSQNNNNCSGTAC
jgi:hypothetical protein